MFVMQALKQREKVGIKLSREAIWDIFGAESPITEKMVDLILKSPKPKEKAKEVAAAIGSLATFYRPDWEKSIPVMDALSKLDGIYKEKFGRVPRSYVSALLPEPYAVVCLPPIDAEFVKNPGNFVKMAKASKDTEAFITAISKAYGIEFGVGWSKP